MAWIDTVSWSDAEGPLRDAYDWQAAALGEPAEFTMLGSLYPAIVEERLRLYRTVEHCPSQLTPIERQSAALVTSRLNGTDHCASGLRLKLESLGLAAAVLDAIDADPANVNSGDDRFDAICAYAAKLTRSPDAIVEDDVDRLREHGLSDLDILDLNNMVAYYAYINRVVMGLGLRSEMTTTRQATSAVPGER
ncbi:MAG: peroxidase-related enzyme [Acidimicrobiaceae bacterium]|nr:peroxidase-related enzyme [Acidimicrobiaceae bacterium]MYH00773.1 peroxidase-related enzyme [Acidimicrobiaceae bacterium]MYL04680.1 peroxidase-related enzyme [Acidimicrobiaceae bacterium]